MTEWQPTNRKGLYVRHAKRCRSRQGRRCTCEPSYRGKRRSPVTRKPECSRTSKHRSAIVTWLEGGQKATEAVQQRQAAGPTFGDLARRWRDGVDNGSIGKRRGRGRYSPTTWRRYGHSLDYTLLPERSDEFPLGEGFGDRLAAEIEDFEWQLFVDRCARRGLKRSTINNHLAVVNAIYSWAAYPTRRLVPRNPTRDVELPRATRPSGCASPTPPRPPGSSPRSTRTTPCRTRSPSTAASAAPSSTASSGPTSTSMPSSSMSAPPRARRARTVAPRSPRRSCPSSGRHSFAKGDPQRDGCSATSA